MFESPNRLFRNRNVIATQWDLELQCLKNSGTPLEASISLQRIQDLIQEFDKTDRIKYCQKDIQKAFKTLQSKAIYTKEIQEKLSLIWNTYFNQHYFRLLPTILIQEIFQWLQLSDFINVLSVCKEWTLLGRSNEVWVFYFGWKFSRVNPSVQPASTSNYFHSFKQRYLDPEIGDKVEVSWHGKFRLETSEVYHGLAWWVAEVVDKHIEKFKIHYPGWEARWDEWVPRHRLRWAAEFNLVQAVDVGDTVELWCVGAHVPGAWLETKIRKVRAGKYCVGKVLASGQLWVTRDRIRLVEKFSPLTETPPLQHLSLRSMLPPLISSVSDESPLQNCSLS